MIALSIVPDVIGGDGAASIGAEASLRQVAAELSSGGADALAVMDAAGTFVGVIAAADIARAVAAAGPAADLTAAEIVRPGGEALRPDDSALDALELMRVRNLAHLPVKDEGGRLLGIVSRDALCEILHRILDAELDAKQRSVFGTVDGS